MPKQSPPPDWIVPKVTIAVAAAPRTGSNYLGELMLRTGRLGQPLEYFHPAFLRGGNRQQLSVIERFSLLAERGLSSNGVASTKFFASQFEWLTGEVRVADWLGTPRWVWLRRRDLLGQSISYAIALQTRAYESFSQAQAEPAYDGSAILKAMNRLVRSEAQWRSYFARTGIVPLELFYEDIEADPAGTLARIAALAEVTLEAGHQAIAERHQRQSTSRNAQWREQFLAEHGDPEVLAVPAMQKDSAPRVPKAPPSLLRRIRRKLGI